MNNQIKEISINQLNSSDFRKELIQKYKDSESSFMGHNQYNESVFLSINETSIVVKTIQKNDIIHKVIYHEYGELAGITENLYDH